MVITERKINALRQMAERGSPEERRSAREKLRKLGIPSCQRTLPVKFKINSISHYSLMARRWHPKTNTVAVWTVATGQYDKLAYEIGKCRELTIPGFCTFYLCNAHDEKIMREILKNERLNDTDYYGIGKQIL